MTPGDEGRREAGMPTPRPDDPLALALERMEALAAQFIAEVRTINTKVDALMEAQTIKERYSPAEIALLLGRSDYTVREWCRKRQIPAEKTANGRDWIISHETLLRLKNRELPLSENQVHGAIQRRRP
jgi:excisionase family DNA binding protein